MSDDTTTRAEVFCPHCREAVGLNFARPIPKQEDIITVPLRGRTITNSRPKRLT